MICVTFVYIHNHVGDTAVYVCHGSAFERHMVDIFQRFSGQKVQPIHVCFIMRHSHSSTGVFDVDNCFEQITLTFLNILSQRVQIRGKYNGSREESFSVFAFAFTEQLFPPFIHHQHARFITHQNFRIFALAQQNVAICSIFQCIVVLQRSNRIARTRILRTAHHVVQINSGNSDG